MSSLDLENVQDAKFSTQNMSQQDKTIDDLIIKALRDQIIDEFFAAESKQIVRDSVLQINDEFLQYQAMKIV